MNTPPMSKPVEMYDSAMPGKFLVEVFSELPASMIQERWRAVNVILRLSILSGLPMELDATLNLVCDLAGEIVPHDRALLYLWDDDHDQVKLCVARNVNDLPREGLLQGNVLNFWATKHGRPLLASEKDDPQTDVLLGTLKAASALAIPLSVSNRVIGSMQFFSPQPQAFNRADAQLLWTLAQVAENLLTREYANEGLIRYAFTDFLTGLKTRGYFEQQLEMEIKRAERKRHDLALLMIDIDFFKRLNDRYGHHVGDQVLRDVASLLMKDMREADTVARYGGEEFVIVLPEISKEKSMFVAQRLRRAVEQAKFFAGDAHSVERLTISTGIAAFGPHARFKAELIENADTALYAAKKNGRNQVVLYSDLAPQQKEVS